MSEINWNCTKEETDLIVLIAKRAVKNLKLEYQDTCMDLTAVHMNDVKLRLNDLLNADAENFAHDLYGINRHLDRTTGKLQNCFLPRYSLRVEIDPE